MIKTSHAIQSVFKAFKALFLPWLIVREQKTIIRKRNGHIRALKSIIKDAKKQTNEIFKDDLNIFI